MAVVFPPRLTESARRIWSAAERRGLTTVQLPTFAVPPGLIVEHLHAGPTFADAVAPKVGLALLEAPPVLMSRLPREVTRRHISAMPIRDAWMLRTPAFIKTPNDKTIRAMIYSDGSRLPGPDAVDADTTVLVSSVVDFMTEHRLFVLDGRIHTAGQYADRGRPHLAEPDSSAIAFGTELLSGFASTLPSAIVIDVGETDDGWAIVEANAAWASGCYLAEPDRVLDVIQRAAQPACRVSDRDAAFARPSTYEPATASNV